MLGLNLAFIDTQLISVLQTTIPPEVQGRVFSTMFTIIKSLNPIGLVIWGIIGEFTPIVAIFLISPGISLIVYAFLVKFTNILHYGEKAPSEEENQEEIIITTDISQVSA